MNLDRARLRPEPLSLAGGAWLVGEKLHVVAAHALGLGGLEAAHQLVDQSLPLHFPAASVAPGEREFLAGGAVHDHVLLPLRELLVGDVEIDPERARELLDELGRPTLPTMHPAGPWLDRPLANGTGPVGHDQVRIHFRPGAQAIAVVTHPERIVERERCRRELAEGEPAAMAGV